MSDKVTDVDVRNEGSVFLFHLNTEAAKDWVAENVSGESMYFGDALVVEPRYAGDLAAGMINDCLTAK